MAHDLSARASIARGAAGTRPIVLDGRAIAARRVPGLAERARAVTARRGRAPRVLLIAFADASGRAPFAERKVRAAADVGVDAVPLFIPSDSDTSAALRSVRAALDDADLDAAFLEFPFPEGIEGEALTEAIPPILDVDIMTAERIRDFMDGADPRPPLTAAAALALVDGYGLDVTGRTTAVVADESPFAQMFARAFARRCAALAYLVPPGSADLARDLAGAGVVIVAAGRPGLVPASLLPAGAVVVDAGYFNPGGRGDVDAAEGVGHLDAFAPVPGGIGPMTISALLERVIEFAEGAAVKPTV